MLAHKYYELAVQQKKVVEEQKSKQFEKAIESFVDKCLAEAWDKALDGQMSCDVCIGATNRFEVIDPFVLEATVKKLKSYGFVISRTEQDTLILSWFE